ncbi:5-formyltetrahydrofolate cyclo-ligase [Chitinimonas sp. BJB300]|uniref:5-formyltetrahydrofolate cyclo-ligase n=1 Tax=Chitinimonas sp. BJB300 TaxID=1559339 RepID=UPI000C0EAB32|nr:5-formyltetrahydrofolate cyclo-ligase [Chitinimonas sp. BJB300]PHV12691.1 5-formyltetrahydrofolate cyclo-ligase [Chitinimonas sp. BJB300]TSJ91264.1 5-formyltetrahydrofolate cyclo-ligase [Chitinimonas sp. BJB300]
MTDKANLRRELRRRRMAVPARQRRLAENKVARRALHFLRPGQAVAAYVAMGSELSLAALIRLALARGCSVWLPVLPSRGRCMRFADVADSRGVWRRNRYDIKEFLSTRRCLPRQLATVFLPLVGFDLQGGRLGQGGGYYDTTFAFRNQAVALRKPRMVGVAFECQRVVQVHREAHDVLLDWVITEKTSYRCVPSRHST